MCERFTSARQLYGITIVSFLSTYWLTSSLLAKVALRPLNLCPGLEEEVLPLLLVVSWGVDSVFCGVHMSVDRSHRTPVTRCYGNAWALVARPQICRGKPRTAMVLTWACKYSCGLSRWKTARQNWISWASDVYDLWGLSTWSYYLPLHSVRWWVASLPGKNC